MVMMVEIGVANGQYHEEEKMSWKMRMSWKMKMRIGVGDDDADSDFDVVGVHPLLPLPPPPPPHSSLGIERIGLDLIPSHLLLPHHPIQIQK